MPPLKVMWPYMLPIRSWGKGSEGLDPSWRCLCTANGPSLTVPNACLGPHSHVRKSLSPCRFLERMDLMQLRQGLDGVGMITPLALANELYKDT